MRLYCPILLPSEICNSLIKKVERIQFNWLSERINSILDVIDPILHTAKGLFDVQSVRCKNSKAVSFKSEFGPDSLSKGSETCNYTWPGSCIKLALTQVAITFPSPCRDFGQSVWSKKWEACDSWQHTFLLIIMPPCYFNIIYSN